MSQNELIAAAVSRPLTANWSGRPPLAPLLLCALGSGSGIRLRFSGQYDAGD